MKIYTKTGDDGTTGLYGGLRVAKSSIRVEAYGTVDELNAVLGMALSTGLRPQCHEILSIVQGDLFVLGAEIACDPSKLKKLPMQMLEEAEVSALELACDAAEEGLPPLKTFILPGGSPQAASLHLARTVCRRAERAVLSLEDEPVRPALVHYLNRLSDLLFMLARRENNDREVQDVPWAPRAS